MRLRKKKLYFIISAFIYPKFVINSINVETEQEIKTLTKNKANLKILEKVIDLTNPIDDDFISIESMNKDKEKKKNHLDQ